MITVKKIEVFEFRGVRHLELDFNNKNFAICGKNGTGKSGIVDALEFGLTGNISRLSGSGTGGITIKEHAPHVDSRTNPAKAKVVITVFIPSLNKKATIERVVSDMQNPTITPATADVLAIFKEVADHAEFTLSRRELIKYVISTPGDRSEEVQALLKLGQIEQVRVLMQKVANAHKRDVTPLKTGKDDAKKGLLSALGITDLSAEKVLAAVNANRSLLNLPVLIELTPTTNLSDGTTVATAKASNISKPHAQIALVVLDAAIKGYAILGKGTALTSLRGKLEKLQDNPDLASSLTREGFLRNALTLVEDDDCPVCDTPVGLEQIKATVQKKLNGYEAISETRKGLEAGLGPYSQQLRDLITAVRGVKDNGHALQPPIDVKALDEFIIALQTRLTRITAFLPVADLLEALDGYGNCPAAATDVVASLHKGISAIPEPTQQDAARTFLIIAQERLVAYRAASLKHKQAEEQYKVSSGVLDTYGKVVTSTLEGLYKDVESNFVELYRFINDDDESEFTAQLTPSMGKLGFDVDFYGRGFFPPGAYHSEGHQDGMGLCLYLALMKHILKDNFTFAVLDDVLMSVDTGHRREVCRLLKEKFPKTQFIITTHDQVWLKHMATAGLIQRKSSILFRKWSVDSGPNQWNDTDVWNEIWNYLKMDDVRSAAALMRHYLEYVSGEMCHSLHARVEYRADGLHTLNDLLPQATAQYTRLLGDASQAARSWGKTSDADVIAKMQTDFKQLVTTSNSDQWQINPSVHYTEWPNLEGTDFIPVYAAFKELTEALYCKNVECRSLLYVVSDKNVRQQLRCSCGTINLNLVKK
ncbi:RecF/RecN/SMC N terminal domain-containing protein [Mucilaginibacter lappiensis]|uniref:Recombinational DNA repair ATPase RecF n=1 Tax=Mucilaginibacter lappiensis TaxID=354630 RepID=A0ABR6PD60_9SPHI|nr:ATP-binding protein [Mucilaginibacter lappiensis]MBB6107688.1 recombinational DNA repair ATPase RecF [Mucilaginibacter lappiensis]SIQ00353.1 RecF/RecN/SMC N terminal domain-containing protein [Mucilaginibacter lappiensis]